METFHVYKDMQDRTGGEIYVGVVGPVRTGKSTFIQKFMDTVVLPHMEEGLARERAIDELPQSAAGRTIMTTEPKFIPEQAATVQVEEDAAFQVRLIDCVGYIVPSAIGYIEEDQPRMVRTPWFEDPIPFNMAAEIGTKKVITEHSTIGLVVTTDGSISDIPREEYEEAEERVVEELRGTGRPFVVLLNCVEPQSAGALELSRRLEEKYRVPAVPVNCLELTEEDIKGVLGQLLYQFPVREVEVDLPGWVAALPPDHWLLEAVIGQVKQEWDIQRMGQVRGMLQALEGCPYVQAMEAPALDLGRGRGSCRLAFDQSLFYQVLGEQTGLSVQDEGELLTALKELTQAQKEFEKLRQAYQDVQDTGYGIVMPQVEELTLEEPKILKQNGKYGIRLKATAPSIHMIRTQIYTEITPIVGSEQQSEELVLYLLKEFEEDPVKIWESNIFGKSLHSLVSEGMHNKLYRMPVDARDKVRETIERVINEGCSGLLCIIL